MDLNIPDTRQGVLAARLRQGAHIVATEVAAEFDVSLDTVRRDILALEAGGKARRVRGGAVPVAAPAGRLHDRLSARPPLKPALIATAVARIAQAPTLAMDGGATTLALIAQLPRLAGRLVITPSPWIAVACHENDIDVFVIGGRLSPQGGVATGAAALDDLTEVAADVAVLGACGLDAAFGLSSDHDGEAQIKAALHHTARSTIVVTDSTKIGRRARHHTLGLTQIDCIITDAGPDMTAPLTRAGARIVTP